MIERFAWALVALAIITVWAAIGWMAAPAFAGNPSREINNVERAVARWTPFQTRMVEQNVTGARYVCRLYDDAPTAESLDSTWQVMVCRKIGTKKKPTGPKS